jgi:hypothetical protein
MSWYRAYFLNDSRRISDVAEFASASDDSALDQARALLTGRSRFIGFELWQESRPVLLHPQPVAP